MKKYDFLSGMFIWTGFDYLGEPTPYTGHRAAHTLVLSIWPVSLKMFIICTKASGPIKPCCTFFRTGTGKPGKPFDVWAYYNHADEVELFLNGKSLGVKKKEGDDLHIMWRVKYEPGH